MIINGITRILTGNTEGFYYTTEKLLSDNVLIEEVNLEINEGIETWVTVYYYNDVDAMMLTLSSNSIEMLSPMVVYRMVKDVVDLHETNTLSEFIAIVKELSIQSMTSISQSKEEHRKDVRERVVGYFDEYKELIEANELLR